MIVSDSYAPHSMADEALSCINSILSTVPGWIADLEDILKTAVERQEEIISEQQPPRPSTTSSTNLPRSRTSLKSKMSKASLKEAMNRANAYLRTQTRRQQPHTTQSDELRLSQRKRKTNSVCSGDQSGPSKFRNKAAVVVYYDGETQKRLEKLVRAIGSSRNAIRKGKMSAKVDALARTGSSSSEASNSSGGEDNDSVVMSPKLNYRSTRPDRLPSFGRLDDLAVFDRVDGQLEKAQSLCERAAHQILRDGDCTLETRNAREHFDDALRIAEAELPALKKRADRAADRAKRHQDREERRRAEEAAEQRRKSAAELAQKIISSVAVSQSAECRIVADALEVDDSSDTEEEELDISALRLTNLPHMRSATRLAAH